MQVDIPGSIVKLPSDTFGGRLRIAIRENGLTIAELCRRAEYDNGNLHVVMKDRVGLKLPNIAKIIKQLPKTDARWLICGE